MSLQCRINNCYAEHPLFTIARLINFPHPALRNSPLREAYKFTRLETHSPFYHPIFNLNSTTHKNKSLTYEQKVCYYVQTFFEIERR